MTTDITTEKHGDMVAISCPFNQDLIDRLKSLGGRWDRAARTWNVPLRAETEARAVLVETFGTDGSPETTETVTVEITARCEITAEKSAVDFCGAVVCRASDRDSGAKVGPNASLISGRIESGGSRQYWKTVVKKGAVLRLELPRAALDKMGLDQGDWSYSIIDEYLDAGRRAALNARREALLAEIAKIDTEIADLE